MATFSIVVGSLSGVAGIGLVVAVMVATVTYRIAREDEPEA